jgi:hypothetical protein
MFGTISVRRMREQVSEPARDPGTGWLRNAIEGL